MRLRILITNWSMSARSGTELYVRDLALELQRRGHIPLVYTSLPGVVTAELTTAGIVVTDSLESLDFKPDIIHGHHYNLTMNAVLHFPETPAIFICHDHTSRRDTPPFHPHIRRYFGVSRIGIKRLREEGVPEDKVQLLPNFVDTNRFLPRPPLPEHPHRVLVFSNYAGVETHLPAVTEACRQAGLALDVIGAGVGNSVAQPENLLGQYDVVFAKAKAAMEAMAVGAAVVLCDFSGVGPLVTSAEFEKLRPLNFGFQALQDSLLPENILCQLHRYDAMDAIKVRDLIRTHASLEQAVIRLITIYRQVIDEQRSFSHPICRLHEKPAQDDMNPALNNVIYSDVLQELQQYVSSLEKQFMVTLEEQDLLFRVIQEKEQVIQEKEQAIQKLHTLAQEHLQIISSLQAHL